MGLVHDTDTVNPFLSVALRGRFALNIALLGCRSTAHRAIRLKLRRGCEHGNREHAWSR
jgi:hypothetical protein